SSHDKVRVAPLPTDRRQQGHSPCFWPAATDASMVAPLPIAATTLLQSCQLPTLQPLWQLLESCDVGSVHQLATRLRTRRPIVLTVDDNPIIHDVYGLAFERKYDHRRAYSGQEALGILRAETIDVMVLDLIMPGLHGLEVLERARKLKPGLIVIISSVINTSQSALRGLRWGASDYFVKPTDPDVM